MTQPPGAAGLAFLPALLGALLLGLLTPAAGLAAGGAEGHPAPKPDAPVARSTAGDAAAIRAVIEAQLAAFQRDDGAEAFSYAAPQIQAQFGTPERFMRMVRRGYAPVYRPRQVFFRDLLRHEGRVVQPLLVTAQDGRVLIALYTMARQPDGSWRIGGVALLPAKAQGA